MGKTTIRILFILAAIATILLTIYNLSAVASQMSDENWYQNQKDIGVVIFDVISGGVSEAAGLQVGDRLVMINGDSIQSSNHAQTFLDQAKPGESLIYTVERGGEILNFQVNLAILGLRLWHVAFVSSGFLFLLFSLFIATSKLENPQARLFAAAMLLLGLFLMNAQLAGNMANRTAAYQVFGLAMIFFSFLTIAMFQHAMLYFPDRKFSQVNRFWMIRFPYILGAVLATISVIIAIRPFDFINVLLLLSLIYMIIMDLLFWKKRRKDYLAKLRTIKLTSFIMVVAFLIGAYANIQRDNTLELVAFVACLLPLAFFYTAVRYRVFEVYVHIRLSIVYSLIQTGLLIGFVFFIAILIRYLPSLDFSLPAFYITGTSIELREISQLSLEKQQQIRDAYLLLFGISITLLLYFSKNKIQKLIDKLFFQQKYDYRSVLKQFGELISSYFTQEDIGRKSIEQIHQIMRVKGTSLALTSNGKFVVRMGQDNMDVLLNHNFTLPLNLRNEMITSKKQIQPGDISSMDFPADQRQLIHCGTPVISGKGKLEAILFTGEKLSESPYNHDDMELLHLFAENLGTAFEKSRLYEESAEKERLKRELEIAREIQINSLPKCDPNIQGLEICSSLSAAMEVGGDYYDYIAMDANRMGILVGDVVGKGTSGAMHMSKIQGFIQSLQFEEHSAKSLFERLNTLVRKNFEPDFFFTALFGVFNSAEKQLELFRMGHNGLIYYNASEKKVRVVEPKGMAFGMTDTDLFTAELASETIPFHPGDLFVFITDGFIEAMDEDLQPFGEQNLCKIVETNAHENASMIMGKLQEAISIHSSGLRMDDATGVIVKILA